MDIRIEIRLPDKHLLESPIVVIRDMLYPLPYLILDVICSGGTERHFKLDSVFGKPDCPGGRLRISAWSISKKFLSRWPSREKLAERD
jgi:hypothetical protein